MLCARTIVNDERVGSLDEPVPEAVLVVVDAAVQLAERGQRRRAHPHYQVLVL